MRILDRSVYVGPSLYAHFPVIRLELDLGELEHCPTGRLGHTFVDGLAAALPGLAEHGCSYREPGGFFRRMREDEGTWLGHVLEHVAIELQNIAGEHVTFGKTRSCQRAGDTGPCGPCSEIHFDQVPSVPSDDTPNGEGDRVIEIWNLVFMQYNRDASGKLNPLPSPASTPAWGWSG